MNPMALFNRFDVGTDRTFRSCVKINVHIDLWKCFYITSLIASCPDCMEMLTYVYYEGKAEMARPGLGLGVKEEEREEGKEKRD